MNKIYVVQGSTGEHDDYREWLVGGFRSEAAAKEKAARCQERANAYAKAEKKTSTWTEREAQLEQFKDEDPGLQFDYGHTEYVVVTLDFDNAGPLGHEFKPDPFGRAVCDLKVDQGDGHARICGRPLSEHL